MGQTLKNRVLHVTLSGKEPRNAQVHAVGGKITEWVAESSCKCR